MGNGEVTQRRRLIVAGRGMAAIHGSALRVLLRMPAQKGLPDDRFGLRECVELRRAGDGGAITV